MFHIDLTLSNSFPFLIKLLTLRYLKILMQLQEIMQRDLKSFHPVSLTVTSYKAIARHHDSRRDVDAVKTQNGPVTGVPHAGLL